jgi:hypothetical protein
VTTIRQNQLPRDAASLGRRLAELEDAVAQLRAQTPDLAAADALLPPLATDTSQWPQTTSTTYATIATSYNVAWKRRLRIMLATAVTGGSTGTVRVMINGQLWGSIAAGTTLDQTAPLASGITIGAQYQITVQAIRATGTGSICAQVQLIRALD